MSDINYRTLRSLTARDLTRALIRDGFEVRRKVGSHERYTHADGRRVTVPYTRRGDTFAIGTLRSTHSIALSGKQMYLICWVPLSP